MIAGRHRRLCLNGSNPRNESERFKLTCSAAGSEPRPPASLTRGAALTAAAVNLDYSLLCTAVALTCLLRAVSQSGTDSDPAPAPHVCTPPRRCAAAAWSRTGVCNLHIHPGHGSANGCSRSLTISVISASGCLCESVSVLHSVSGAFSGARQWAMTS